jgi:hypothetical protein
MFDFKRNFCPMMRWTWTGLDVTPRPNTNRHVHAHKCWHCAGIEPATSCVVGEYSHHYATSAVIVSKQIHFHIYYLFVDVWFLKQEDINFKSQDGRFRCPNFYYCCPWWQWGSCQHTCYSLRLPHPYPIWISTRGGEQESLLKTTASGLSL